jgi:predicted RecB family nuclease
LVTDNSGYEQTIIKQLSQEFPQYEERLLAICDRLFDLLAVVRTHCYHPDFHGSYSLKAVLPALVPDMTYSDLEIQDGSNASAAFAQMIAPDTEKPDRERIRGALLGYCERDTQAMVRLLQVLLSLGRADPSEP